jgi:hypothetical protein
MLLLLICGILFTEKRGFFELSLSLHFFISIVPLHPLSSLHAMQAALHSGWVYPKMNYTTAALIGGSLLVGGIVGVIGYALCGNNAFDKRMVKIEDNMRAQSAISVWLKETVQRHEALYHRLAKDMNDDQLAQCGILKELSKTFGECQRELIQEHERLDQGCMQLIAHFGRFSDYVKASGLKVIDRTTRLEEKMSRLESFVSRSHSGNTEL